ncbi:MAG TPA: PfkB family carbohydrate kinase [Candidatus Limnocylindria bacterium]|jgi:hydroxymethylpyrimidine kinase/phosphomethylpyrimidine kinase|nr:PfkB family carbohydrate kinase [Candidatus Limnocylindria bacterium]
MTTCSLTPAVVATVGTTHPLAFAGLAFAVLALAADGVRPVCVVAGVSAQDATHVLARSAVDAATIGAQFAALREAHVAAFHVGALLSAGAVRAVAEGLAAYPGVPVVVDPVFAATGGDALADDATRAALRETLIPRATLVTPNLDEASALLGERIDELDAMHAAARAFVALGARAALVKGGHLRGDAVDVLADDARTRELAAPRLPGALRGTGDLLASTIAAALARGATLDAAVDRARARVRDAITRGVAFAGTRVAPVPANDEGPS